MTCAKSRHSSEIAYRRVSNAHAPNPRVRLRDRKNTQARPRHESLSRTDPVCYVLDDIYGEGYVKGFASSAEDDNFGRTYFERRVCRVMRTHYIVE